MGKQNLPSNHTRAYDRTANKPSILDNLMLMINPGIMVDLDVVIMRISHGCLKFL